MPSIKIKNNKLTFFKKITGTNISDLAGLNPFKPRGDAVLFMLGYVQEPFDEFYTKRGALAEKLAAISLRKRGLNPITYNPREINWDNFPDNPYFGGLIDIELPNEKTIYEIKSKSIADYDKISRFGDKVQEQQAMHYAWLRGYSEAHIMWIFFDTLSENLIRNNQPLTTYKNLKMFEKTLPIDFPYQDKLHQDALDYYLSCISSSSIPLSDVSDKYLTLLKLKNKDGSLKS